MITVIALLLLGLLLAFLVRRTVHDLRRHKDRLQTLEIRRARAFEDACWSVLREREAALAQELWRRGFPRRMTVAVAQVNEAMQQFGAALAPASESARRLAALFSPDDLEEA